MGDSLTYKLELINDLSDAAKNMQQFKIEVENNIIPLDKIKTFYAWYHIKEQNLFCPSKYIKYKNMTYDMYNYFDVVRKQYVEESSSKYFHGKVSDIQKYHWFKEVIDTDLENEIKEKLSKFLESSGYKYQLKSNTKFYFR
jgi:hypothetical protein